MLQNEQFNVIKLKMEHLITNWEAVKAIVVTRDVMANTTSINKTTVICL